MNRATWIMIGLIVFLATATSHGKMPKGEYLEGKDSKIGVILAHGQGLDSDSPVVGLLRKSINIKLGFHTLTLQMPEVSGKRDPETAQLFASTFPEVCKRIQAAIEFLRKEKGVERLYLLGYGTGGRMTSLFLANHPNSDIAGFISVGSLAGDEEAMNTNLILRKVRIPVLDVYAENDQDAKFAEDRKAFVSKRFKQVPIPNARHDYSGHEDRVTSEVIGWLEEQTR